MSKVLQAKLKAQEGGKFILPPTGVFKTRKAAEREAYKDSLAWRNVIEKELEE